MIQKCSKLKILEVFFVEPSNVHFIRGISKKIGLAQTSVRNNIKEFLKEGLIKRKQSKPFAGFVANRENDNFIFYKRIYNLYSLKGLIEILVSTHYPKLMIVYGSYSIGEDIENSDIDIFILSKTKKEPKIEKLEKKLKRKIHLLVVDDFNKLDKSIQKKISNGIVLHGGF